MSTPTRTVFTIKARKTSKKHRLSFTCTCGTYEGGFEVEAVLNAAIEAHIAAAHAADSVSVERGGLL